MKDYRLLEKLVKDLETLHEEVHRAKEEGVNFWEYCGDEEKMDTIIWYMERIPMQIRLNNEV